METLVIILGLLGAAKGMQAQPQQPQIVQHYYSPQTGKYYTLYNGYIYEQNVPYYQRGQGPTNQGMGTPNWAPQPPVGGWYPQQQTQTITNSQGY